MKRHLKFECSRAKNFSFKRKQNNVKFDSLILIYSQLRQRKTKMLYIKKKKIQKIMFKNSCNVKSIYRKKKQKRGVKLRRASERFQNKS